MVVKAVSEQGVRLNIRKETPREWRREFARHLRTLGIAANADRFVRGETTAQVPVDAASERYSIHMNNRVESSCQLLNGNLKPSLGKSVQTRKGRAWMAGRERDPGREGQIELACKSTIISQMSRHEPKMITAAALLTRPRAGQQFPVSR